MPAACHFQCGETASIWNWNGNGSTEGVTVFTCPTCGIYGVTQRVEECFRGPEARHLLIEREFLGLRPDLLQRRPQEAPPDSHRVGVISMRSDDSGLELAFITPKS